MKCNYYQKIKRSRLTTEQRKELEKQILASPEMQKFKAQYEAAQKGDVLVKNEDEVISE